MTMAREAAVRHVANSPESSDRLAVLTASGNVILDFTDDRQKVRQTLAGLRFRPEVDLERRDMPALTYYEADQIRNNSNGTILATATSEALDVSGLVKLSGGRDGPAIIALARSMARASAARVLMRGPEETRASLDALKGLVRRIAALPGERTIVLISPGFYTLYERRQLAEVIDLAVRRNVIVHALDPAGIIESAAWGRSFALPSNRDTLVWVAEGTGGTFFHDQNDLDLGFKRTVGAPEFRYLLGFTPESLKSDGSFHELKVKLRNAGGQSVQARHGYFAPDGSADPAQTAKQEMVDALFSRQEIRDVPTEVHAEFFKRSDDRARLSVVTRIDVKQLPYRKVDGRNRDDLTVISALFDRNGNYLAGSQKAIEMRLRDQTLASEGGPSVAVKSNFDVKPGTYMIRVVVRDAEGQRMSAASSAVEIP
jgi:VWFA-related protein